MPMCDLEDDNKMGHRPTRGTGEVKRAAGLAGLADRCTRQTSWMAKSTTHQWLQVIFPACMGGSSIHCGRRTARAQHVSDGCLSKQSGCQIEMENGPQRSGFISYCKIYRTVICFAVLVSTSAAQRYATGGIAGVYHSTAAVMVVRMIMTMFVRAADPESELDAFTRRTRALLHTVCCGWAGWLAGWLVDRFT